MSEISEEIRYAMLFYYKKGKNAAKTCRKICEVYGENAVSERRIQEWFTRFRSGNLDVKDAHRSGRPVTEKVDEMKFYTDGIMKLPEKWQKIIYNINTQFPDSGTL